MPSTYYLSPIVDRAMKVQEVILRAIEERPKWYRAAEILGIPDGQTRWLTVHFEDNLEYG